MFERVDVNVTRRKGWKDVEVETSKETSQGVLPVLEGMTRTAGNSRDERNTRHSKQQCNLLGSS